MGPGYAVCREMPGNLEILYCLTCSVVKGIARLAIQGSCLDQHLLEHPNLCSITAQFYVIWQFVEVSPWDKCPAGPNAGEFGITEVCIARLWCPYNELAVSMFDQCQVTIASYSGKAEFQYAR